MMHLFDENFWIAISFVIFLYFAYRPLKKAVLNSLDTKIDYIKENLQQAEMLKAEAKQLLEEVQNEIKGFDQYQAQLARKAQEHTDELIAQKTREIESHLNDKKSAALKFIANEKDKASKELHEQFVNSVIELVRHYLAESKNNSLSDAEIVSRFIGGKF